MASLIYLDPDDEITSAASRIRSAGSARVGLVLPFASRVATSRINFRLLAREAASAGRQLDLIAPDPAARALAASAGLRVFATVPEYEAAVAADGAAAPALDPLWAPEEVASAPVFPAPRSLASPVRPSVPTPGGALTARTRPGEPVVAGRHVARPRGSGPGPAVLVEILIAAVLVGIAGTAIAMMLPAAEITVVARTEAIPPIAITVTADPAITAVDAAKLRIPARLIEVPASADGQFTATGTKVTEAKAAGSVRFESINTVFAVTIAKGTRVSTLDGVVFTTTAAIVVPTATVSGSTIHRGAATVAVAALKAGPAGNVAAGAITQLPATLVTQKVGVSNPAAAVGGTHTETVQVSQADVDAAVKQLQTQLQASFTAGAASPAGLPAGATVYPATAQVGAGVPDQDLASLVGMAEPTFSLALSATGTVMAVDAAPARAFGEAAVQGAVGTGYRLVDGSIAVQVAAGVVADGLVTFAVTGTGSQLRLLDAETLKSQVLGLSDAAARSTLGAYGSVTIGLWPGWVTTVPSNASRVTVKVEADNGANGGSGPGSSASPVPSG